MGALDDREAEVNAVSMTMAVRQLSRRRRSSPGHPGLTLEMRSVGWVLMEWGELEPDRYHC